MSETNIIQASFCPEYFGQLRVLPEQLDALKDADISSDTFSFYASVASVFSSKSDGKDLKLGSFIRRKETGNAFQPSYQKSLSFLLVLAKCLG